MEKDELRKLLNQPYKTENWKKITEFVFPNVSYLQKPLEIPFESDKVEAFKQIGNVKLSDGKNLAMFEVHVSENVNISRNKVELRKLVADLIDKERNHGVLVVYEQGKEDYRFTFTAKSTEFNEDDGDFVNLETDAKRYTYILGKNETCKTAASRFWELKDKKDNATIKDVEQAFSVDRLNKEFFNKYKDFYEDFVQYITGKRFVKEKGKWVEKSISKASPFHKSVFKSDDKQARNFVKLLMGRLVFIQFLQKKGWMGVPLSNKKWEKGDPEFVLNLFKDTKNKEHFHSEALYPLFYDAFNTPNRKEDKFDLTKSRVPYLNGGLFENEYPDSEKVNFPADYFERLLDFFGQYNFTIDENDPLDHEVGIDPEMLGHIFENLLEDNKDKGAFYTPKPIVQYMCQESLIQYLITYLQENKAWPTKDSQAVELEENLQNFVRKKVAGNIIDYDELLATALRDVKICDPAIGSGAFPMGLLNEIFNCMQVLFQASRDTVGDVWKMQNWEPDIVKKNIIQHSIYGVDLEKGAVDIARLRFWLSLIVEEKIPYPLPNLDFKIMQGNSLLESYEGIELSQISGSKTHLTEVSVDLFGNPIYTQTKIFDTTYIDYSNISEEIENYFTAQDPIKKQTLKKEIESIIHKHIDFNLEFEEKKIKTAIADLEFKANSNKASINDSKGIKEKKEKVIKNLTSSLSKENENLNNLQKKRKELHNLQNNSERPYFLWHLYFKDVFEKGGFDIVIGNPPYIGEKGNEKIFHEVVNSEFGVQYYSRWMDFFYFFFHKGLDLLKQNGVLALITTNYFVTSTGAIKLRSDIRKRSTILKITNFNELKIFDSATGQHNSITILLKSKKQIFAENLETKRIGNSNYNVLNTLLHKRDSQTNYYKVSQEDLFEGNDNQIRIAGSKGSNENGISIESVINKMRVHSEPLSTITKVLMGLVTRADSVSNFHLKIDKNLKAKKGDGIFVLNKKEIVSLQLNETDLKKYVRPLFKNSDVRRYYSKQINDLYLLYIKDEGKPIKLPPSLNKHFERFEFLLTELKKNFLKNEIAATFVKRWLANGNYFVLFNPKKEEYFNSEKIVCPYRSKINSFSYNEIEWYGLQDICYILPNSKEYNLKYILAILNSPLCFNWLFYKGKRKGSMLEIGKNTLGDIPIRRCDHNKQNYIIKIVEQILNLKKINPDEDTSSLENKVNCLVYILYELSYEEVMLIDPNFPLSEMEFRKSTLI